MMYLLLKRSLLSLISILAVIMIIYFIIYKSNIDPTSLNLGQRNDSKTIENLKRQNYFDQNYFVQIIKYLSDISPIQFISINDFRLENYKFRTLAQFGQTLLIIKVPYLRRSIVNGELVGQLIIKAMLPTLLLAFSSILIAILAGIGLGILSVQFYNKWQDHFISSFCSLGFSIPSYISAIFFSIVFGFILFPLLGLPMQGSLYELNDSGDSQLKLVNLILPSIALGIRPISVICQMTRSSILEVMQQNYIRTAKAKGLPSVRFIGQHLLKNAMNPIITTISSWFASLLTGSFFIEYVFNYRGLGDLLINAMNSFDVPLILGCCILITIVFSLINLITDTIYSLLDPRIKTN